MATKETKETIYVDVDDEITNIIDKVKQSDKKIVALVLPKRATVMQSVVNMKLLKKAATQGKKSIVLITSEAGLLPLAGVAGLHVAKTLQSKPVIPPPPQQPGEEAAEAEETIGEEPSEDDPQLDKAASIGVLAAAAAAKGDDTETIELDNAPAAGKAAAKPKRLKHLKVPNFERFRTGFFLAGLALVLLIVGWYFAFIVMPKATVTIRTDTTSVVSSFDFTASTNQAELDVEGNKIPAVLKEVKKTDTEKVTATGEKDLGTKASGDVTLSVPCASGDTTVVPAGTVVSTGGLNFITQQAAAMNNHLSSPCRFADTVEAVAAQNGDSYNIGSGKTFTVAGYSGVSGSNGSGFSGGTTKMAKVVSQKDIDDAVGRIKTRTDAQATDELKTMFEAESLFILEETRKEAAPKITSDPALDKEAVEATVTYEVTYTMLGIKEEHLQEVIKKDVEDSIDLSKQAITDYGIDEAIMRINNQPTPNEAFISFRTSVVAGPEIDETVIKENIRGKKRGEAEKYIEALPGVQEAVIEYSPFWVYSTPKSAKKITIIIEKPGDQSTADTSSNGNN